MAHGLAPVPPAVVAALQAKLLDAATLLPAKYRVLFALRGAEGEPVHAALLRGARAGQGPGLPAGGVSGVAAVPRVATTTTCLPESWQTIK